MSTQDLNTSAESLSFEQALQELERIVRQLEEGRVPLEEAVKAYEKGAELKKRCDVLLKNARTKIEEIMVTNDGSLSTKPSDLEQFVKDE
jgi:exodeoxyribonuclease VII small subunit